MPGRDFEVNPPLLLAFTGDRLFLLPSVGVTRVFGDEGVDDERTGILGDEAVAGIAGSSVTCSNKNSNSW